MALTPVGIFLCFCLAELAAAFPDRAGGLPSYAFETFKPLGDGVSEHISGLSSSACWLGRFTVTPINTYLTALYITDLLGIPFGGTYGPISGLSLVGRRDHYGRHDSARCVRPRLT